MGTRTSDRYSQILQYIDSIQISSNNKASCKVLVDKSYVLGQNLPKGWIMLKHEINGLFFYYSLDTGVVSWTRPYVKKWKVTEHNVPKVLMITEDELASKAIPIEKDEYTEEIWRGENRENPDENENAANSDAEQFLNSLIPSLNEKLLPIADYRESRDNRDRDNATKDLNSSVDDADDKDEIREGESESYKRKRDASDRRKGPLNKKRKKPKTLDEMSAEGKTAISFLQEFCNHILDETPTYILSIQDDPNAPFLATVKIGDTTYGKGAFSNKKVSKQAAAEATLEMLCPGKWRKPAPEKGSHTVDQETASKTAANSPVQLVQEYCNANHCFVDFQISHQPGTSTVDGTFTVVVSLDASNVEDAITETGTGRNKREAKAQACEKLMYKVYPNIKKWDDVLDKWSAEKETKRIENLSSVKKEPNLIILQKLKNEMQKRFVTAQHSVI